MRASAREEPSVLYGTEPVLLTDALTTVAVQGAVQVLAGKVSASFVLLEAGVVEPLRGEKALAWASLKSAAMMHSLGGTIDLLALQRRKCNSEGLSRKWRDGRKQ